MVMPSKTRSAYSARITRSLKVPGSPSSALQTTYLRSPCAAAARFHFAGGEAGAAAALEARGADLGDDVGARLAEGGLQARSGLDAVEGERVFLLLRDSSHLPSYRGSWRAWGRRSRWHSSMIVHLLGRHPGVDRSLTSSAGPWSHIPRQLAHSS
jgi:hypothetical protein